MVKVAVLGLAAVFLSLIAGTVLLLGIYSLSSIRMVIERIHEFEQAIGLSREYLGILLKMLGIAYLTQLVVNLCRDAGNGAVASQINMIGKISMMLVSFPVVETLLKTLGDMLR